MSAELEAARQRLKEKQLRAEAMRVAKRMEALAELPQEMEAAWDLMVLLRKSPESLTSQERADVAEIVASAKAVAVAMVRGMRARAKGQESEHVDGA